MRLDSARSSWHSAAATMRRRADAVGHTGSSAAASESEIHKILSSCPNKQSDSDPIPTWLLKECASVDICGEETGVGIGTMVGWSF